MNTHASFPSQYLAHSLPVCIGQRNAFQMNKLIIPQAVCLLAARSEPTSHKYCKKTEKYFFCLSAEII
jgi:hypothetical protein